MLIGDRSFAAHGLNRNPVLNLQSSISLVPEQKAFPIVIPALKIHFLGVLDI